MGFLAPDNKKFCLAEILSILKNVFAVGPAFSSYKVFYLVHSAINYPLFIEVILATDDYRSQRTLFLL